jgi:hypothetical protein
MTDISLISDARAQGAGAQTGARLRTNVVAGTRC